MLGGWINTVDHIKVVEVAVFILKKKKYHDEYCGRHMKRGLYISKNSVKINADVNGSYDIMRKAVPSVFNHGIEGLVVNPIVVEL